jgi:tRNA threonylcarbamoyl adenosine modification protein YjeE
MTEALSHHREFDLSDETATLALGSQVAGKAQVPQVIFLRGDLGAGKTTFSRGFLRGRGHHGSVKSPTYTLVEPYESVPGGPVFHLDLYRLGDAQELAYLGLGDYLSAEGILLIEWPERAEAQLPRATLDITLTPEGSGRKATVRAADPAYSKRCRTEMPLNWKQAVSDIPAAVRLRGAHALLMIIAAITLVLVSAPTVSAADVDAVRLWRAPDHTRVVLDLSGATDFSTLSLENPERFVVDISQSRLSASLTSLPLEGTPISRVRSGIRQGTDLRLVFDLSALVRTSVFLLPPNDTTGHRVVIDLFDKTPTAEPKPVLSVESLEGRRDIVIAIDPGHGGEDPARRGRAGCERKPWCCRLRVVWKINWRKYRASSRCWCAPGTIT